MENKETFVAIIPGYGRCIVQKDFDQTKEDAINKEFIARERRKRRRQRLLEKNSGPEIFVAEDPNADGRRRHYTKRIGETRAEAVKRVCEEERKLEEKKMSKNKMMQKYAKYRIRYIPKRGYFAVVQRRKDGPWGVIARNVNTGSLFVASSFYEHNPLHTEQDAKDRANRPSIKFIRRIIVEIQDKTQK